MSADESTISVPETVNIPRWFLWVVSMFSGFFTVLFIPWAAWVSVTLAAVTVKIDQNNVLAANIGSNSERIQVTTNKVGVLESEVTNIKSRIQTVEGRMRELEQN